MQISRRQVYATIAVFCFGWLVILSVRSSLYALLVEIGDYFSLTGAQLGTINSIYFLVYVVAQVPAGVLGDRFGAKRILVIFLLVSALGLLAASVLAHDYLTLVIAIAVHAAGIGSYYSASYAITIVAVHSRHRAVASSIISVGMNLGMVVGFTGSSAIYELTADWRLPFGALSVIVLLLALLCLLVLPDVRPSTGRPVSITSIARDRTVIFISIGLFCSLYGFSVVSTWAPAFLRLERGISPGLAALSLSLMAVLAIPAALLIGRLADSAGRRIVCLGLLLPASASICAMAYIGSTPVIFLSLAVYGIVGKLTWDSVAVTWLGDHSLSKNPEALMATIGFANFIGNFSSVLAPLLSGIVKDVTGSLDAAFLLASLVLLGAAGCCIAVPDRRIPNRARPIPNVTMEA